MANFLTTEESKLVAALHSNRQLERLQSLLQRRLDEVSKQLRQANADTFQRVQGRAQELEDLLKAFTPNASSSA